MFTELGKLTAIRNDSAAVLYLNLDSGGGKKTRKRKGRMGERRREIRKRRNGRRGSPRSEFKVDACALRFTPQLCENRQQTGACFSASDKYVAAIDDDDYPLTERARESS